MPLVHLASRLYGTPLLIARSKLDVILAVLGERIGLATLDAAVTAPPPRSSEPVAAPGIAVLPVHGTLVRRTVGLEAASGLLSHGRIASSLDAALTDPQVAGILLDIDSPGGEAGGVFELAERIRTASRVKPIWAHANDAAFSAAYAIAAAAERVTLSQTAGLGSIGVIALHVDQSVKDAKEGLSYTTVYAGHHKNDFTPHAPLSPDAAAALQAEVNRLYGIFVAHVARMRGLDETAVRALEARLVFGEEAVGMGLADAVSSLDRVLAEFTDALRARGALAQTHWTRLPGRTSSHSLWQTETTMHEHDPCDTLDAPVPEPAATSVASGADVSAPHTQTPTTGTRAEAQAIAEICLLAGVPERTAAFLADGLSEAQVRRALLEARAEQPEITSRITPEAGTTTRPDASPVVAAVKKLAHKE